MPDPRSLRQLPRAAGRSARRRSLATAERVLLGPLVSLLVLAADRRLRRAQQAPDEHPPR
jgi:hypothetical protein